MTAEQYTTNLNEAAKALDKAIAEVFIQYELSHAGAAYLITEVLVKMTHHAIEREAQWLSTAEGSDNGAKPT